MPPKSIYVHWRQNEFESGEGRGHTSGVKRPFFVPLLFLSLHIVFIIIIIRVDTGGLTPIPWHAGRCLI